MRANVLFNEKRGAKEDEGTKRRRDEETEGLGKKESESLLM
jgi:hypothetical protein